MVFIPKYLSSTFQVDYAPFWTGLFAQPDAGSNSCVLVGYKFCFLNFYLR